MANPLYILTFWQMAGPTWLFVLRDTSQRVNREKRRALNSTDVWNTDEENRLLFVDKLYNTNNTVQQKEQKKLIKTH